MLLLKILFHRSLKALTSSVVILLLAGPAFALEKPGEELKKAQVEMKLGDKVDLDLPFTSTPGEIKTLRQFLQSDRPTILVPVYFECPSLCGFVLQGVKDMLNEIDFKVGKDFQVLAVSFSETEDAELAQKKAQVYHAEVTNAGDVAEGFRFLASVNGSSAQLMQQIGFNFIPDEKDFAHSAALVFLTPQGEISQYFSGVLFNPRDVRLALVEASRGAIGTPMDQFFLSCFRYDHLQGKYTWAVYGSLRIVGAITIVVLVGLIGVLVWREKKMKRSRMTGP